MIPLHEWGFKSARQLKMHTIQFSSNDRIWLNLYCQGRHVAKSLQLSKAKSIWESLKCSGQYQEDHINVIIAGYVHILCENCLE